MVYIWLAKIDTNFQWKPEEDMQYASLFQLWKLAFIIVNLSVHACNATLWWEKTIRYFHSLYRLLPNLGEVFFNDRIDNK